MGGYRITPGGDKICPGQQAHKLSFHTFLYTFNLFVICYFCFFVQLVFTKLGSSLVSRCGTVNCVRVACVTAKSVCHWQLGIRTLLY